MTTLETAMSFENLKKSIKSFDLILSTSDSLFSTLINYSQQLLNGRGKYTHIAFCIRGDVFPIGTTFICPITNATCVIHTEELYLFESVFDTKMEGTNIMGMHVDGVQIRKFNDVFDNYFDLKQHGSLKDVAWVPMSDLSRELFNKHSKEEILNIVMKYINLPYNCSVIDKVYIPLQYNYLIQQVKCWKDYVYGTDIKTNGVLCTELVCHILMDFKLCSNVEPHKLITEDFFYVKNTRNFPKIYLDPLDIIK